MSENTSKPSAREVLMQAVIATAYADGEVAEVEKARISQLIDFLRLEGDARARVEAMMDADARPELPAPADLPSYDMRLYTFQQALILAFEDGVIHRGEEEHLDSLAQALELRPGDVEKGWQRAREMRGT